MKIQEIFADSAVSVMAKILAASLPFMTVGMFGWPTVMCISVAVGSVAMLGLIFRFAMLSVGKREAVVNMTVDKVVGDVLSFPYAFALCSVICMANGVDAAGGLWLAGVLAVLEIFSVLPKKG